MIPFSPPRIDRKIIDEVIDTLQSGWITTGPKTKLFEKKLAEYVGIEKVLCVNSATAGMELMLRWFGVKQGDEVIIPAYTYCATANVVVHCGAKPVMVDVGEDFNVKVSAVEGAITEKTKVIMPVDFGGLPCDYEQINNLVKRKDIVKKFRANTPEQEQLDRILVLADAAHSVGAQYKGKVSGSLADISVFSFHAVKNLTTAEGGAICLNIAEKFDVEELYKELNIKALHGQTKDALAKAQKADWEYDVVEPGYKCNMPDILASIGLVELARYQQTLEKRQLIFNKYSAAFAKYGWAQIPLYRTNDKASSCHVYALRIKDINEQQRNRIIQHIFGQEVAVNVHFKPLPLLSFYKSQGYRIDDYPTAYDNYARELSLPVYYDLSLEQVELIIQAVVKAVERINIDH